MVRTELQQSLHRLANLVECKLPELFQELLNDSRFDTASDVVYAGCRFVEALREAHGTMEGGGA